MINHRAIEILNLSINCESETQLDELRKHLEKEIIFTDAEWEAISKVSRAYEYAYQLITKNRKEETISEQLNRTQME